LFLQYLDLVGNFWGNTNRRNDIKATTLISKRRANWKNIGKKFVLGRIPAEESWRR